MNKDQAIYLYGKTISTRKLSLKYRRVVREMIGLELLIQKGIMVDIAIVRLNELAKEIRRS